jgi:hypothetical protein
MTEVSRIHVEGHEEGDLIVTDLHGSCGDIPDGIVVRFVKNEGLFVLNPADLANVLALRKV